MATRHVRFYLDENLSPEIVKQLQLQDIDVIRGTLGSGDAEHLQRATDLGCTLCTEDDDFLKLAAGGLEHPGIVKGDKDKHSIGDWLKFMRFVHAICSAEELRNQVLFLFDID